MARSERFAGVEIHPDGSLRYGGEWQDTATCHAEVETAGQVRDRATLTRVVGGALVAGPVGAVVGGLFRKRVDDREVWLVVTGDKHDWVVPVRSAQLKQARLFVAEVNSAARSWAERVTHVERVPSRPRSNVYQPGMR